MMIPQRRNGSRIDLLDPMIRGQKPRRKRVDYDQISMNWMRMNGLGPSLRPFLNGGNHTPKKTVIHNSQSTTQISRLGSLRRMHAAEASIDGKLSLSGTQADVATACGELK
uniref:FoP_duplication domain-containing protein n=1 Tax=Caenorhabditis tropicalis TaxID=1561998 RepID=A0A1I7UL06_9PELO